MSGNTDPMNLFIDSNIFLSFYDFTSHDIQQLDKLCYLIDDRKLQLLLPEQVVHETARQRDEIVNRSLRGFKKLARLQVPSYGKAHDKYEELMRLQRELAELHATIVADLTREIENRQLQADLLLDKLFNQATLLKTKPDVITAARRRIFLGNPPGKRASIGDAVNWETLLACVPSGVGLTLVSADGDYSSALNRTKLKAFLRDEWEESKATTELYYYPTLSRFFEVHHKDIQLTSEKEREKDDLIDKLLRSGSFMRTHKLIARLDKFEFFSLKQAEALAEIPELNDQVGWIIDDSDVSSFYGRLYKKYGTSMSREPRESLESALGTIDSDPDDEFPF